MNLLSRKASFLIASGIYWGMVHKQVIIHNNYQIIKWNCTYWIRRVNIWTQISSYKPTQIPNTYLQMNPHPQSNSIFFSRNMQNVYVFFTLFEFTLSDIKWNVNIMQNLFFDERTRYDLSNDFERNVQMWVFFIYSSIKVLKMLLRKFAKTIIWIIFKS